MCFRIMVEKPRDYSPRGEELAFITWILNEMTCGLEPNLLLSQHLLRLVWEIMTEANDFCLTCA